jgi:hypothetical protein
MKWGGVRLGAHCGKGEAGRAWHTWQWRGGGLQQHVGCAWRTWADRGRREMGRAQDTEESLIYSNNFQMSFNCFDQKVDLPSS